MSDESKKHRATVYLTEDTHALLEHVTKSLGISNSAVLTMALCLLGAQYLPILNFRKKTGSKGKTLDHEAISQIKEHFCAYVDSLKQ